MEQDETKCEICHCRLPSSAAVADYERSDLCVVCETRDILGAYWQLVGDDPVPSSLFDDVEHEEQPPLRCRWCRAVPVLILLAFLMGVLLTWCAPVWISMHW